MRLAFAGLELPRDDGHYPHGGHGVFNVAGRAITERGIGNGISLIIFAGIVARLPNAIAQTFDLYQIGQLSFILLVTLTAVMLGVVAAIVFLEEWSEKDRLFNMPSASSAVVCMEGRVPIFL